MAKVKFGRTNGRNAGAFLDHLLGAKRLVAEVGGVETARYAVDVLNKLQA